MRHFILIHREGTEDYDSYAIDTNREVADAQEAMLAAGVERADEWAGDPSCPDSYRTGNTLRVDVDA